MVATVQHLIDAGHEVILWSGCTRYARIMAARLGLHPTAALGKPDVLVDNQIRKWGGRLKSRMISPAEFLHRYGGQQ